MANSNLSALIGLQRFGLGGREGQSRALEADPRGACLAEIRAEAAMIHEPSLPSTRRGLQIFAEINAQRRARREAKRNPDPNPGSNSVPEAGAAPKPPDPDEIRLQDVILAEARARFDQALSAPVGFAERWVMFWSNHFCVALRRGGLLRGVIGSYEREAIRPHVFGRFVDLLLAAEQHPAMLFYLDQPQSIGPGSPAGQRRQKGLNENLAREILELHTIGVGGGYQQADVTAFAKVLTGWTLNSPEEMRDGFGAFTFMANRHEPGPQTILGKRYDQPHLGQGEAVLRDLAAHPATARFIAGKIARHFVSDTPPPALVARLEADFRATGGDLAALARTLLGNEEAWQPSRQKLRTPAEFLIAALRATGEKPERPQQLNNWLNLMGQPLWNPVGPNGHPDDVASLAAPRALKLRLDVAAQIARPAAGRLDPRGLAEDLFGSALSTETRAAIARAETRAQGLAILLMSSEFQRR